jgi:hypothetical protein
LPGFEAEVCVEVMLWNSVVKLISRFLNFIEVICRVGKATLPFVFIVNPESSKGSGSRDLFRSYYPGRGEAAGGNYL